jgi:hypothetical protein
VCRANAVNPSGSFALSKDYRAHRDGTYGTAPIIIEFNGNLNGLGNAISHLTIKGKTKSADLGFFAELGSAGTIASLHVTKSSTQAKQNSVAGFIASINLGMIFNSSADNTIKTAAGTGSYFGGLVGTSSGEVANS